MKRKREPDKDNDSQRAFKRRKTDPQERTRRNNIAPVSQQVHIRADSESSSSETEEEIAPPVPNRSKYTKKRKALPRSKYKKERDALHDALDNIDEKDKEVISEAREILYKRWSDFFSKCISEKRRPAIQGKIRKEMSENARKALLNAWDISIGPMLEKKESERVTEWQKTFDDWQDKQPPPEPDVVVEFVDKVLKEGDKESLENLTILMFPEHSCHYIEGFIFYSDDKIGALKKIIKTHRVSSVPLDSVPNVLADDKDLYDEIKGNRKKMGGEQMQRLYSSIIGRTVEIIEEECRFKDGPLLPRLGSSVSQGGVFTDSRPQQSGSRDHPVMPKRHYSKQYFQEFTQGAPSLFSSSHNNFGSPPLIQRGSGTETETERKIGSVANSLSE